jgi:hypothetical protein
MEFGGISFRLGAYLRRKVRTIKRGSCGHFSAQTGERREDAELEPGSRGFPRSFAMPARRV